MRFVLDASVALAWFLPDQDPEVVKYADRVLDPVERKIVIPVVPSAWHEEVAGVLMRRLRAERLTQITFDRALELFWTMQLETYLNAYTVGVIVERATQFHLQALDALYLDLAILLDLPLATVDGGLRTAAKVHGVKLFDLE